MQTYNNYVSFEHICAYVNGSGLNLLVIVIYRPGSVCVTDVFFNELEDLLERIATYSAPLLLLGDVNVHLDVADDPHTVKFYQLLATHGLKQHVAQSTHVNGHLLDVVIAHDQTTVGPLTVDPPGILSDHSHRSTAVIVVRWE